jgi:hypothetical protein
VAAVSRCLAIEVLGSARRLVELTLNLVFGVASRAAYTLFDLTADVSSRARYAVIIHSCDLLIMAGAAWSALLFVSQATRACRQGRRYLLQAAAAAEELKFRRPVAK